MKSLTVPLSAIVTTRGDGLWAKGIVKDVQLTSVTFVNPYEDTDNDFSYISCTVSFDIDSWNVEADSLVYTDSCINDITAEVSRAVGLPVTLEWSEMGMQGSDYLHFDCVVSAELLDKLTEN